ncbi:uncharacterized protein METZ01_LOCUS81803 [marine metagenome]|uniref:Uncharacterized protein n=1 Tax=marine metagenome TaxID=408172 RepID=A0A381ULE4_9ZZZZ
MRDMGCPTDGMIVRPLSSADSTAIRFHRSSLFTEGVRELAPCTRSEIIGMNFTAPSSLHF